MSKIVLLDNITSVLNFLISYTKSGCNFDAMDNGPEWETGSCSLGWQSGYEKGNSEFKPAFREFAPVRLPCPNHCCYGSIYVVTKAVIGYGARDICF